MDFFQLRERSYGLRSSKGEKQDYEDSLYQHDGDDARAASDLENKKGYTKKQVIQIVKANNPDVRDIRKVGSSYKVKYK